MTVEIAGLISLPDTSQDGTTSTAACHPLQRESGTFGCHARSHAQPLSVSPTRSGNKGQRTMLGGPGRLCRAQPARRMQTEDKARRHYNASFRRPEMNGISLRCMQAHMPARVPSEPTHVSCSTTFHAYRALRTSAGHFHYHSNCLRLSLRAWGARFGLSFGAQPHERSWPQVRGSCDWRRAGTPQ